MVRDINCRGCGECVKSCPEVAITIAEEKGRKIDWGKCNQCLQCVDACIYGSLNICGRHMEVKEVFDEVIRDEPFYKNSGGGVTVSGGEALSQSEFVTELLEMSKKEGLHTALDTTGYAPWEKMERVLNSVDLVLFDIKHLDSREHKRTTSVKNELILENLEKTSQLKRLWLRMPLIKGYNDSEAYIRDIALLGKRIGAEKISLLPYHEGGESKCEQLGRSYLFTGAAAPDDEHIDSLKQIVESLGIKTSIGS